MMIVCFLVVFCLAGDGEFLVNNWFSMLLPTMFINPPELQ